MTDPASLAQILWSDDPLTRRALWTIIALVVPIAVAVFTPAIVRLLRLYLLERRLRDTADEYEPKGPAAQRSALREWVRDSALQRHFEEFERRWSRAQLAEGGERAPIRLLDVLEDRPLLPFGPRRSLLPALPGLFLGIGVLGAIAGLIPGLAALGSPTGAIAEGAGAAASSGPADPLALQLGLALRATAWGFIAAISAQLVGRLVEGGFEARSRGLDEVLARAYRAVSPGELAEIERQTQQRALETLGRELTQFAHELNERLERGLQRIEQSSSRAASLVSQEQRGALHTVVQELSLTVRQGVEHHLNELRTALQRTVEYQSTVTNGLSESFERMAENAALQDRVAHALAESANALDAATHTLASEGPAAQLVGSSDDAMRAADPAAIARIRDEQAAFAARLAGELGQALRGFTEQVEQIDRTMAALRADLQDEVRNGPTSLAPAAEMEPGESAISTSSPAPRSAPAAPTPATASATPRRPDHGLAPEERSWSAAPIDRRGSGPAGPRPAPPSNATPPPAPAYTAATSTPTTESPPPMEPAARPRPAANPTAGTRAPSPESGSPIVPPSPTSSPASAPASADGPLGRELSLSGFRVGAPRALGPDPYERLAGGGAPPSNVRPFPTRERELGDDLKLSGLLGPSTPRSSAAEGAAGRSRTPAAPRGERERSDASELEIDLEEGD
ncbi:MAG: hypothetical protein R3F35_23970 [Myxococcota bacterium]